MRRDARRVLVAYDIGDDRRRTRVAAALQAYGDRVQYSVFVIDASPARQARMKRTLLALIDASADSVLVCDLGLIEGLSQAQFDYLGRQRVVTAPGSFVV